MDFPGCPGDVLVAVEEGNEGVVNPFRERPSSQADLYWSIGAPARGAGRLEIDGSEDRLGTFDTREIVGIGGLGKLVFKFLGHVGPDFSESRVVRWDFEEISNSEAL